MLTFSWDASKSLEVMVMSTSRNHRFSDNRFVPSPEEEKVSIFTASLRKGREGFTFADWTQRVAGHKCMYEKTLPIQSR